jgi:hypothetical protein
MQPAWRGPPACVSACWNAAALHSILYSSLTHKPTTMPHSVTPGSGQEGGKGGAGGGGQLTKLLIKREAVTGSNRPVAVYQG